MASGPLQKHDLIRPTKGVEERLLADGYKKGQHISADILNGYIERGIFVAQRRKGDTMRVFWWWLVKLADEA